MSKIKILIGAFIAISVLGITSVNAQEYPEPSGYIVDSANVLSDETEAQLTEKIKAVDEAGTAQIAILTISTIQPLEIEDYGIELAEKWKVGDAEKDNGLIFIVVTEDRRMRIEVGYGLEGVINDAKAGRILDDHAVPYFKDGKWDEGTVSTIDALIAEVNQEPTSGPVESEIDGGVIALVIGGIVILLIIGAIVMVTPGEEDDKVFFYSSKDSSASSLSRHLGGSLVGAAVASSVVEALQDDDEEDDDDDDDSGPSPFKSSSSSSFGGFSGGGFGGGGASRGF